MVIQGVSYPSDFEAKKAMMETAKRLEEMGCAIAGDGTLSMRVGPNAVWITANDTDKGALKQDGFIRVDLNGKQMPGTKQARLPEDVGLHLSVYGQNPALRAIIHAYPVSAVALAKAGQEVPAMDDTPSLRKLGRIGVAGHKGQTGLENAVAQASRNDSGALISGDGCMMWGESLAEAFSRIQSLEYCAKLCRALGKCAISGHGAGNVSAAMYSGGHAACHGGYIPQEPVRVTDLSGVSGRSGGNISAVASGSYGAGGYAASSSYETCNGGCAPGEFHMEGLTDIVRPGQSLGSTVAHSTAGAVSNVVATNAAVSQKPQYAAPGMGVAARPAMSVTGGVAAQPQPTTDMARKREKMMAEVVRRSLKSL
jgi:L-fuculose-phosphate aldolase